MKRVSKKKPVNISLAPIKKIRKQKRKKARKRRKTNTVSTSVHVPVHTETFTGASEVLEMHINTQKTVLADAETKIQKNCDAIVKAGKQALKYKDVESEEIKKQLHALTKIVRDCGTQITSLRQLIRRVHNEHDDLKKSLDALQTRYIVEVGLLGRHTKQYSRADPELVAVMKGGLSLLPQEMR